MDAETLWRPSLVLALYRNRHAPYSRFVQLATVRADGRPANRTVVFRGFLDETPQLTFVTDSRSPKVAELSHSPWAEVCWYFPVTHEQFRIGGPVDAGRRRRSRPRLARCPSSLLARAGGGGDGQLHLAGARRAPRWRGCRFPPSIPTPKNLCLISAC